MIVRNEDFEVLSGQTVRYDRKAESGNVTAANFCAHCYGWLVSNRRPPPNRFITPPPRWCRLSDQSVWEALGQARGISFC
jgi:hypothetical protein